MGGISILCTNLEGKNASWFFVQKFKIPTILNLILLPLVIYINLLKIFCNQSRFVVAMIQFRFL